MTITKNTLLLIAIFGLIGCGGKQGPDVTRYRVSGSVNFDSKPVPAGMIVFEPDTQKGNKGPTGSAKIVNGKFDTASVTGTVGGPHNIRVEGYDGKTTPDLPFGKPIFVPHTQSIDLPKKDTTQDLSVPADAAKGLQTDGPPA